MSDKEARTEDEVDTIVLATNFAMVEEMIWQLADLDRPARMSEARAITRELRRVAADEIEQARQEGWADGYFEGGALSL